MRWQTTKVKEILKGCPGVRSVSRQGAPDEDDIQDWDEIVETLLVSFKGKAWCHVVGVPADAAGESGDFEARAVVVARPQGWRDWDGAVARELVLRDALAGAGFAVELR